MPNRRIRFVGLVGCVSNTDTNRPLPSRFTILNSEGLFLTEAYHELESPWHKRVKRMVRLGYAVSDETACAQFPAANNYYRFAGCARYFQKVPHLGDDDFRPGTRFDEIRAAYDADKALRAATYDYMPDIVLTVRRGDVK